MTTSRHTPEPEISISSSRKDPPDLPKLGRALIALAIAEDEAEAQAKESKGKKKGTGAQSACGESQA